jgi:hypothetical protein
MPSWRPKRERPLSVLPLASTSRMPAASAALSAASVFGVISFLSFVSVPSTSSRIASIMSAPNLSGPLLSYQMLTSGSSCSV